MTGILTWSVGTAACGLAEGFWSFFGARVLVGLGEAMLVPAASSMIIDYFPPRRRGLALGFFSMGGVLGSGVAVAVGGFLLAAVHAGAVAHIPYLGALSAWRTVMILAGLPGFMLLPFLLMVVEPPRQHTAGLLPMRSVYHELLANNGKVLRVAVVVGIIAAGDYGLMAWFPALLQRHYGFSATEVGTLLGLAVSLSGVLACIFSGALADAFVRWRGVNSRIQLMLPFYLICLASTVLLLISQSGNMAVIALGIWILGSIGGYVVAHIVVQELVSNEMRATTIAVSGMSSALIGLGIGPTSVALTARYLYGSESALIPAMTTVGIVTAVIAIMLIWRPTKESFGCASPPSKGAADRN